MKILVADDDPINRKILRVLLTHEGHTVVECADGLDTLACLEKELSDAIISDVLMPKMDGYRLCYEIRRNTKFKHVPVILYTATYLSADDEKAAIAMGADKFIRKPALPEVIVKALREVVEKSRTRRDAKFKKPGDLSALREYSEVLVRKLEETNIGLTVANEALTENERRLRTIIECEPECVKVLARDGTLLEMNPAGLRMIEADSASQVIGEKVAGLVVPEHRPLFQELTEAAFRGESRTLEFQIVGLKGTRRWLDSHAVPLRNSNGEIAATLAITRDITDQKHDAALLHDQMHILEMIACGAPLRATLDALLCAVEARTGDMLCSIFLLDAEGKHLRRCAAPQLPEPYIQAIDGAAIGEGVGCCGTAVHRREPVVVEDIASDPLWNNWRQIALSHGLRACWSTPIFDAQQQPLGSFAMYVHRPQRPAPSHQRLIRIATHIASIAISKRREEDSLRESEERLRLAASAGNIGVWQWEPETDRIVWSEQQIRMFGWSHGDRAPTLANFIASIHADDRERVKRALTQARESGEGYAAEYRIAWPDGSIHWVASKGNGEFDDAGRCLRMMGIAIDVTERKRAELERQKNLDKVRALHEINLALTSTVDRQNQLEVLLEKLERFFTFPTASTIRLLRAETGRLESLAHRGLNVLGWLEREPNRTLHRALRVVETRAPVIVADIRREAHGHALSSPANFNLISYAGVPLIARGYVLGVLGVYTKELHPFDAEEIEFLTTVASQAAIALENAQLYQETERRRREAEELARIARSLTETLDLKAVGDRVVTSVLELTKAKGATLRLLQPDKSLKRLSAVGEVYARTLGGEVMPGGVGLAGRALAEGKTIWSADTLNDPRVAFDAAMRNYVAGTGHGSMIAVPLRVREKLIGTLTLVDRTGRSYSNRELEFMQTLADQVALALQNARLYEQTGSQLKRIEALREIERAMTSTLDLDAVLHLLLEKIDEFLPFSSATTIRLYNRVTGGFENTACRNMDEGSWRARVGRRTGALSRQMAQSKRPMIIPNIQEIVEPDRFPLYRQHGFVSYLGVPLIVKDEVVGILGFYTKVLHEFTEEEVDFLLTVAGQGAIAINNARLYDEITSGKKELEATNRSLDRSLKQLDSLHSTLAPLAPGATNPEVMNSIIGRLIETTGADAALIRVWNAESQSYNIVAHSGYPEAFIQRLEQVPPTGSVGWVVQHGEPILAPDIAAEQRFQGKHQLSFRFRSCAMLPLIAHDDVLGVMQLSSQHRGYFDEEHRDHLMAIARQMSIAMENRRLFNELKSSRDDLEKAHAALIESNRMLTALHAVATASSQSLDLDQILNSAIQKMIEIFNFDATRIHLFDKQRETLTLRASFEHDPKHFSPARSFRRGEGVVGAVVQAGEKMIFTDAPNDSRYWALTSKRNTARHSHHFLAVLPIRGKATSLGAISCVNDSPRSLTASEIQLLEAIADQLEVAIENSWLYEDVRSKVDELQFKTMELERANKVKDEFLGVVSHELRTPINVIMGYTALFKDGVFGEIKAAQEDALIKIARESKDLLTMINTLLSATTLEKEPVAIETQVFSVESLLAELRANYAVTVPKQLTMHWHYPENLPPLRTDRRKLRQTLDNLIGNAVKFTNHGTVTITARIAAGTEQSDTLSSGLKPSAFGTSRLWLEFAVSDTGLGMPPDTLAKIFDKFFQADSSETRSFGGVGMGLFIAKQFAELLGGQITVESTEGKGSTFTLLVPCEQTFANAMPVHA